MVEQNYFRHTHDGVNSEQIEGRNLKFAPQSALTSQVGGTLSTGGTAVLSTGDSQILSSVLTRVNELEARLKTLGLIK